MDIKLVKYICIKDIQNSISSLGYGKSNLKEYKCGDIFEVDEKTMLIDGDYNKDFLQAFKYLKSLKIEDYFVKYDVWRAINRDAQLEELLKDDE